MGAASDREEAAGIAVGPEWNDEASGRPTPGSGASRWGGGSNPPDEAYGRVTDPERFRPLHVAADALVAELESDFEVDRTDGLDVDPELSSVYGEHLRTTRLTPRSPAAAPVTISWSAFPGVHVRLGHRCKAAFPICGCDACDEEAEWLVELLRDTVLSVTRGDVPGHLGGDDTVRWSPWERRRPPA